MRIQRYSSLRLGALGRLALALADRAPADVEVEFAVVVEPERAREQVVDNPLFAKIPRRRSDSLPSG